MEGVCVGNLVDVPLVEGAEDGTELLTELVPLLVDLVHQVLVVVIGRVHYADRVVLEVLVEGLESACGEVDVHRGERATSGTANPVGEPVVQSLLELSTASSPLQDAPLHERVVLPEDLKGRVVDFGIVVALVLVDEEDDVSVGVGRCDTATATDLVPFVQESGLHETGLEFLLSFHGFDVLRVKLGEVGHGQVADPVCYWTSGSSESSPVLQTT